MDTKVGFSIKEMNFEEHDKYCMNSKLDRLLNDTLISQMPSSIDNGTTLNFELRIFSSGCYYLDKTTGEYSSEGVDILEDSNFTHTHCLSTHLTEFAAGFIVLPSEIHFDEVFANSSFDKNPTIYITVILVCCLYILLLIWSRLKDRKDSIRARINILDDNQIYDDYFYEFIVFTGSRLGASTTSNARFFSERS